MEQLAYKSGRLLCIFHKVASIHGGLFNEMPCHKEQTPTHSSDFPHVKYALRQWKHSAQTALKPLICCVKYWFLIMQKIQLLQILQIFKIFKHFLHVLGVIFKITLCDDISLILGNLTLCVTLNICEIIISISR